jgi:hypothetical protein
MDEVTPKIRFGIVPGSSARISEEEHEAAGPRRAMRIAGGTSARAAEAEARAAEKRPYGVSMQARTGKPCTMDDLMAAEAEARYGQASQVVRTTPQGSDVLEEKAHDSVRRESFQPMLAHGKIFATAGDTLPFAAAPAAKNEETRTESRSPFQTLRSLFSRTPGTERHDRNQSH